MRTRALSAFVPEKLSQLIATGVEKPLRNLSLVFVDVPRDSRLLQKHVLGLDEGESVGLTKADELLEVAPVWWRPWKERQSWQGPKWPSTNDLDTQPSSKLKQSS